MVKIGKIFLWILVFAAAAIPAVFMDHVYGYLPLLFLVILIGSSVACMQVIKAGVSVQSEFTDHTCERGKAVQVGFRIENRSFLLCPKASANIHISDLFGGEDAVMDTYFTMAPRDHTKFAFDMDMPHVGVYQVGLKQMEVYDLLGVFRKKLPVDGLFEVYCKPVIYPIEENEFSQEAQAVSNRDTKQTMSTGTDYTGVRDYAMGDPMKQIHWKLSAHSLNYMTKLFDSSQQTNFAVILDFAAQKNKDREELMDLNDCLIETALSLVDAIARQHTEYALLYGSKDNEIKRKMPKGRENDLELIQDFAFIMPDVPSTFPDAERIVQEEGRRSNRSTNLLVCTSYVTDALIQELLRVKRQRRSPMLYYIIPAGKSSREIQDLKAPLRQFEEASVPYRLITTAVQERGGQ